MIAVSGAEARHAGDDRQQPARTGHLAELDSTMVSMNP
jgi:hypothetical protein